MFYDVVRLEIMKLLGSVLDLGYDTFIFVDKGSGMNVSVFLQCGRGVKILDDIRFVAVLKVFMMKFLSEGSGFLQR